jgi:hypothetical protein
MKLTMGHAFQKAILFKTNLLVFILPTASLFPFPSEGMFEYFM